MRLTFIRHAQPAWRGLEEMNPGLTERGHEQAAATAERLRGQAFDALWVSQLTRARETAEPIARAVGLEPRVLTWLEEARPPDFTRVPRDDLARFFHLERRRPVAEWWESFYGSEDPRAFHARIANGLEATLGEWGARRGEPPLWHDVPRDQHILAVAHAGTIAAALSDLMGLPQVPWSWERFLPGHASLARVKTVAIADGVIFSLRSFNDAEHLPAEQRTR